MVSLANCWRLSVAWEWQSHGCPVLGGPALSWAFLLGTSSGFSWWLFKDPLVSPAEGGRDEPLSDMPSILSVTKAHCPGKRIASKYSSVNLEKRIPLHPSPLQRTKSPHEIRLQGNGLGMWPRKGLKMGRRGGMLYPSKNTDICEGHSSRSSPLKG